ncbi:hypothetical protein [Budvicia aquatica]|nr:hypothetical protein [Budvicia aquatica]
MLTAALLRQPQSSERFNAPAQSRSRLHCASSRILAGRAIFLIPSATFVMLELKVKDEMGVEAVYQFLLLFFEFLRG